MINKIVVFIPENCNPTGGVTRCLYNSFRSSADFSSYTAVWMVPNAANAEALRVLFPEDTIVISNKKKLSYYLQAAELVVAEEELTVMYQFCRKNSVIQIANNSFVRNWHHRSVASKMICAIGDHDFLQHLNELGVDKTKLFQYDYAKLAADDPYDTAAEHDRIGCDAEKPEISLLRSTLVAAAGNTIPIGAGPDYVNSDDVYRCNSVIYTRDENSLPYWVHTTRKEIHVFSSEESLSECLRSKIVHPDADVSFDPFDQKAFESVIRSNYAPASSLSRSKLACYMKKVQFAPNGMKAKVKTSIKAVGHPVKQTAKQILFTADHLVKSKDQKKISNESELVHYKDLYKGKRCFLIGNGPSLRAEDLDTLQKNNEITFGCNKVYKMFGLTQWRPTYLCMIDALIAKYQSHELRKYVDCPVFTNRSTLQIMNYKPKKAVIANNVGKTEYQVSNNFGAYYYPSGATVMSFMLELAMYMGFDQIYLLGVDCTSSLDTKGHAMKGYFNSAMVQKDIERIRKRLNNPNLTAEDVAAYYFDKSTYSYATVKKYADKKGFHIFNATRGGALEVFERKDFDSLFNS